MFGRDLALLDAISPEPAQPAGAGPDALRRITCDYAARPELWAPLLRYGAEQRWSMRVHADDDIDIWLITWLQEQSTALHDHGGSAGAFTVVSGRLREYLPAARPNEVGAGRTRSFGADHVHDVGNPYPDPAASVHAYSPPLTRMSYYAMGDAGRLELLHTGQAMAPEGRSMIMPSAIIGI